MPESLSPRMWTPAIEASKKTTTVHNSYLKLNTTHGHPGHLEPGHPQLGCIHFLFTISNKTQGPKSSPTASAVSRFLLDDSVCLPQSPAPTSVDLAFLAYARAALGLASAAPRRQPPIKRCKERFQQLRCWHGQVDGCPRPARA